VFYYENIKKYKFTTDIYKAILLHNMTHVHEWCASLSGLD